jgi:cell division transport system permease protein
MKNNKYKIATSGHIGMQSITSGISITLVLLLLGMIAFFILSAKNLSVYVRENIGFSVAFTDSATDGEVLAYWQQLKKAPYVKSSTYISRGQALKEASEALGTNPTDFVGYNPYTPVIEVRLKSAYANSDSIDVIERQIKRRPDIEDISYQKDLVNSINTNIRNISLILLALAVLLTVISFVLINNTIRLSIYSKRFIIYTMKLVGASWGFIRRPFILRNLWVGIIAALVANILIVSGTYWLLSYEPELVGIVTPEILVIVGCMVFFFGIFITMVCVYFSLNKYLRMKANALYNI